MQIVEEKQENIHIFKLSGRLDFKYIPGIRRKK